MSGRGRRHGPAQAARRRAGRRRRHPRRHPAASGVNAAGRTIGISLPNQAAQQAAAGCRCWPRPGSTPTAIGLLRGAWHRHRRRRPDRGRRARPGVRPAPRRRAAADRLGQDQYRPYRAGLRHGRAAQGHAGAAGGQDPRLAAPRDAQPEHRLRRPRPARANRPLLFSPLLLVF